jgi:hypothetical protein
MVQDSARDVQCVTAGQAGCERMHPLEPCEIFAHNNAKRKKIMFSVILENLVKPVKARVWLQ